MELPQASGVTLADCETCDHAHMLCLQSMVAAGASADIISACAAMTEDGIRSSSRLVQQLLLATLRQMDAGLVTAAAAQQLFQLRDAQASAAGAVVELLTACVERGSVLGVQLVGQLPAAAQIDQQSAERLLQAALQKHRKCRANELLCSLLQLPAAKRIAGPALVPLLRAGIECSLPLQLVQLLCDQLPAARQGALDAAAVRQLLLLSFEEQQWVVFDWLRKLPAAPLDDEQVALCCGVRCYIV